MNNKTKEERQAEIKPIIVKLRELKLTIQEHTEIKELFIQMQLYINEGVKVELDIPFPSYGTATTADEAVAIADRLYFPILVRPSYVLGGQGMKIVINKEDLEAHLHNIRHISSMDKKKLP